jgi:hypothetical protein
MAPVHALDAQSPHAGVASAPGAAQSSSNRWWENDPWHSANTPLHRNIQGDGGNGVLTGEELGSVVALGVKEGNDIEGVRDGVLLLHTQEGDVRKQLGH